MTALFEYYISSSSYQSLTIKMTFYAVGSLLKKLTRYPYTKYFSWSCLFSCTIWCNFYISLLPLQMIFPEIYVHMTRLIMTSKIKATIESLCFLLSFRHEFSLSLSGEPPWVQYWRNAVPNLPLWTLQGGNTSLQTW